MSHFLFRLQNYGFSPYFRAKMQEIEVFFGFFNIFLPFLFVYEKYIPYICNKVVEGQHKESPSYGKKRH